MGRDRNRRGRAGGDGDRGDRRALDRGRRHCGDRYRSTRHGLCRDRRSGRCHRGSSRRRRLGIDETADGARDLRVRNRLRLDRYGVRLRRVLRFGFRQRGMRENGNLLGDCDRLGEARHVEASHRQFGDGPGFWSRSALRGDGKLQRQESPLRLDEARDVEAASGQFGHGPGIGSRSALCGHGNLRRQEAPFRLSEARHVEAANGQFGHGPGIGSRSVPGGCGNLQRQEPRQGHRQNRQDLAARFAATLAAFRVRHGQHVLRVRAQGGDRSVYRGDLDQLVEEIGKAVKSAIPGTIARITLSREFSGKAELGRRFERGQERERGGVHNGLLVSV